MNPKMLNYTLVIYRYIRLILIDASKVGPLEYLGFVANLHF